MNDTTSILTRIAQIFVNNIGLKILSVAFALALFLIVRNQQVREFNRTVRVRLETERGIVVIGSPERVLNATLRMPDTLFSRVPSDDELTGEIDLRKQNSGKIRVAVSGENFPNLDKRYALTMHEPFIDVELDKLEHKRVQIKAVLQGLPKPGFEVSRVSVSPSEVDLIGARQELSKLDALSTIPVDITNLGGKDYSAQAGLSLDIGGTIRPFVDKVTVKVNFIEKQSPLK
ncbi:hypothetical protein EBU99_03300 [bacterium]|nr:hypothetical protein [bacterium]